MFGSRYNIVIMDRQNQSASPKIRKFIDHYAEVPATPPVIEDSVIDNPAPAAPTQPKRNMDALSPQQPADSSSEASAKSEPEVPQVVGNQGTRSDPSAAMQRTFDLQEEINRRRSVTGK